MSTSSSRSSPELVGTVSFRLDFSDALHHRGKKRKRKETAGCPQQQTSSSSPNISGLICLLTTTTSTKTTASSSATAATKAVNRHNSNNTEVKSAANNNHHYLLDVPVSLREDLWLAYTRKQVIGITDFVQRPIMWQQPKSSIDDDGTAANVQCRALVQVTAPWKVMKFAGDGENGTKSTSSNKDNSCSSRSHKMTVVANTTKTDFERPWTLRDLSRLELFHKLHGGEPEKRKFTVQATVLAVSAIITMDPDDPFVLLQIYQEDDILGATHASGGDGDDDHSNEMLECTVVLRGSTSLLAASSLLVPGSGVVLTASRQPWNVPKAIRRRRGKEEGSSDLANMVIPSHVLVAQEMLECRMMCAQHNNVSNVARMEVGTIMSTERRPGGRGNGNSANMIRIKHSSSCLSDIFLDYFPMSQTLQIALTPGAQMCAWNLQTLDEFGSSYSDGCGNARVYAATLMSTIVVTRFSSSGDVRTGGGYGMLPIQRFPPAYRFFCENPKAKITWGDGNYYRRTIIQQRVSQWISAQDWVIVDDGTSAATGPIPSIDDIVRVLENGNAARSLLSKPTKRNPYLEFFGNLSYEILGSERTRAKCLPTFHTLECLRSRAIQKIQTCLAEKQQQSSLSATTNGGVSKLGWHGSIVLDTLAGRYPVTGGFWRRNLGLLSTGNVGLPVVTVTEDDSTVINLNANSGDATLPNVDGFAFCPVERVVASFLCLGEALVGNSGSNNNDTVTDTKSLVPYDGISGEKTGACSLLRVGKIIYIVGVFIHAKSVLSPTATEPLVAGLQLGNASGACSNAKVKGSRCSVKDSLDPEFFETPATVEALMLRTFFKVSKIRNRKHSGLLLTLCQLQNHSTMCTAQCLEIKAPVDVDESRKAVLLQAFSRLGVSKTDDQVSLSLAWWRLASRSSSCSFTTGGRDDVASTATCSYGIKVSFPFSCRVQEGQRGYVRICCEIRNMTSSIIEISQSMTVSPLPTFHFYSSSGKKMLPGMLDRGPFRSSKRAGPPRDLLYYSAVSSGIGVFTLGDLHLSVCKDVGRPGGFQMAPSLVREVRAATLLGVSYCRAQAECLKCFQTLVDKTVRNSAGNQGVISSVSLSLGKSTKSSARDLALLGKSKTSLSCPNKCDIQQYGSIKWECSGTIDDGTGQAKLYAERDVVQNLLSLSQQHIQTIENAAWFSARGVEFSAGIPPSQALKDAVVCARSSAYWDKRMYKPKFVLADGDVLRYMTPHMKGTYLLQRHCLSLRLSAAPTRRSYLVRCKPLSDAASHLNHTDIQLAVPGVGGAGALRATPTYTLPALKLNLVDTVIHSNAI